MKKCCIECFGDDYVINIIKEEGYMGDCDYCNCENVMCIDINKLSNMFEKLLELYEETTYGEHYGLGQSALDFGSLLIDLVQGDWNLFADNLSYDNQTKLLFDILNYNRDYEDYLDENNLYSNKSNSFTHVGATEIWDEFAYKIKYKNRFFIEAGLEREISLLLHEYSRILKKGEKVFRARIGYVKNGSRYKSYPVEDMGMPPIDKTKNGRANPVGIPYLYAATSKDTAIAEVRPNKGQLITLATIELIKDTKIIDLTKIPFLKSPFESNNLAIEIEQRALLRQLSIELSKPIEADIGDIEYVPTQYLTELIKNQGYEGLVYKSCLGKERNIVFFNEDNVVIRTTELFKVEDIHFESSQQN